VRPPRNPLAGTRAAAQAVKRRGLFVPKQRERRRPGDSRRPAVDPTLDQTLAGLGVPLYDSGARAAELGGYMAPRDGF